MPDNAVTPIPIMGPERVRELWTAVKTAIEPKADRSELDQYTTPSAVATAIATALAEYAKKSDVTTQITNALAAYITQTQLDEALQGAIASAVGMVPAVVDVLPSIDNAQEKVLYLVPSKNAGDKNIRDEYLFINGSYELIGSTNINLSSYWSKQELTIMTSEELQELLV